MNTNIRVTDNMGLVLIDLSNNKIINIDSNALKIFGYKNAQELIGQDFHILIPSRFRNLHRNIMKEEIYKKIIMVPRNVLIQDTKGRDKKVTMTNYVCRNQAAVTFTLVPISQTGTSLKCFIGNLTKVMLEE